MRSTLRILALAVILLLVLVPLAAQADGPCPDDPELSKDCYPEAPPFYVVINRDFEALDRPGTGCQPIILDHPECEECDLMECTAIDIEGKVCARLEADQGDTLYAMCCDCATDPNGQWTYVEWELDGLGGCEVVGELTEGLPPGTGIDLPAPVIIGGLAALGAVLLAAGMLLRRRTLTVA
jgi:hypothetical protein